MDEIMSLIKNLLKLSLNATLLPLHLYTSKLAYRHINFFSIYNVHYFTNYQSRS